MYLDEPANLTFKVQLPGGQRRLKEAVLYVASKCFDAPSFGLVKLNKILWKADFDAFAERSQPVTGRQYSRQKQGPVPVEMLPVLNEMVRDGLIEIASSKIIDYDERRPRALVAPSLKLFSASDLSYLDRSIEFYWDRTGREASDDSHGVAWKTRENGDLMPYELAYLSDEPLDGPQKARLLRLGSDRGWRSA
jgi:hypothetical protein